MSIKKTYIIKPEEITSEYDELLIGRKVLEFKKIMEVGFNIPKGFIITSDTFKSFLDQANDIKSKIENILLNFPTIEEKDLELKIEKNFIDTPYPPSIEKEIIEAYQELSEKLRIVDAPVSIKISLPSNEEDFFEKEDLIEIERNFQNIRGEKDLLFNIKRIWSVILTKLLSKMEKRIENIFIALYIQKSVYAKASGTITPFTPEDLDRSKILIESTWGLIESLILKDIKPDIFIIKKNTKEIVEKIISKKNVEYIFDSLGEGLMHKIFVPPIRQGAPSLSNEEILSIMDLALKIEKIIPSERIIVWSLDKDLVTMYGLTVVDIWKPKIIVEVKPPEIIKEEEVSKELIEEEVKEEAEIIEEEKIELSIPKIEIIEKPFIATATKVFTIFDAKNILEYSLESFFDGFLIKGLKEDIETLLNIEEENKIIDLLVKKYKSIIEKNLFKPNIILINVFSQKNEKGIDLFDFQLNIIHKIIEENRLKNIQLLFSSKEIDRLPIDKIKSIKANFLIRGVSVKLLLEINSLVTFFSINELKKIFDGFLINGDSLIKESMENIPYPESLNNFLINIINQLFSTIDKNESQILYLIEKDRYDLDFIKYLINKKINTLIVKPEILKHIKEYLYSIEQEIIFNKLK